MDKNTLDALNKEMFELTLKHYQTPFHQELVLPPPIQPPLTTINEFRKPNINASNNLLSGIPQKERNNNKLADYQFNHIFSNTSSKSINSSLLGESTTTSNYNSTKDVINERMSGHSSLARAMAFTGFGSAKAQIKNP